MRAAATRRAFASRTRELRAPFLELHGCDLLCIFLFFCKTRNTPHAAAPRGRATKNPARHPARAAGINLVNTFFWKILVTRVNRKTGSSTRGRKRSIRKGLPLLRLDTRELHHLSPFLGFLGDELGEVGRRACKYFTAEFRHSCRRHRLGERPVDLPIEPLDDLARGALVHANAEEAGHRVARDNIANHWNVRQHPQARLPRHAKRAQRTRLAVRYRTPA